jgi:DNA modification methylase
MPTLNWIGKDAVIRHHKEVPFRLLEADAALSHGGDTGNLIVQGDNLHALKALLPKYAGKVKCIYIDPPYNTGNEGWVYNDKVNSPEINRWLGSVVGKEAEDLSRHDKWLCMMYPRMVLLKQFLSEDGVIFVSIDDNEVASLRLLMDEIFGRGNFVATIVWKSRAKPSNTGTAKVAPQNDAEYILCFKRKTEPPFKLIHSGKDRSYPHEDSDGKYRLQTILKSNRGENKRETMQFSLDGYTPPPTKRWQAGEEAVLDLFARNRITFQTGEPMLKYYQHEESDETSPFWCSVKSELSGTAEKGKNVLNSILGIEHGFDTVKPLEILEYILSRTTDKDSIILDSFAGSGTTGHAVLKQNAEDGGTRKFILVEMEGKIAREITAERVRRVAGGYTNAKGEAVAGLGGGFQFCTLSEEPLFNEFGDIREDVTFAQLADFVWFAETGEGYMEKGIASPLHKPGEVGSRSSAKGTESPSPYSPLLGVKGGTAVYLLFNGILGDRRPQGGNILTQAVLDSLPPHEGPKVIYAAATRLGPAALQRAGIVFKQTPYAIEV